MGGEFSLHLRLWYKLVVVNFIFHHHYFLTNNYSCDQAASVCSNFVCGFWMFTVVSALTCPIMADSVLMSMPFSSAMVAKVWRRS